MEVKFYAFSGTHIADQVMSIFVEPSFRNTHVEILPLSTFREGLWQYVFRAIDSDGDSGCGLVYLSQTNNNMLMDKLLNFIFSGHNTRKQLTPEILSHLHHVLWDRAAKNYEV